MKAKKKNNQTELQISSSLENWKRSLEESTNSGNSEMRKFC